MMKDVASAQINVRTGQVDFHVHVIGGASCVDVHDGLILRVVDKPADAVGGHGAGRIDQALHNVCAGNGGQVELVRVVNKTADRVEIAGTRSRVGNFPEHEGVVAGVAIHDLSAGIAY